jgi:hypothetical protein
MLNTQWECWFFPEYWSVLCETRQAVPPRVSSKQSNFFFGSNRNKPKLNLLRLFVDFFRETKKHFFGLFRCFRLVSKQPKQTEFSRNKLKQTEKIFKKRSLLGGPRNRNFFSRFEPKQTETQSVLLFFGLLFCETNKFFFRFVSMFQTGIETTEQTELMVWGI